MNRSLTVEFNRVIAVIEEAGMKVISNIDTYRLCVVLLNDVFRGHIRYWKNKEQIIQFNS